LSEVAKQDLIRIYHYGIRTFGKRQADTYFELLRGQFKVIADNPYAFVAVDEIKFGYRRCVCGSENIFYIIKDHGIEIRTITGSQETNNIF
jgi:toxin ParE1/3/4